MSNDTVDKCHPADKDTAWCNPVKAALPEGGLNPSEPCPPPEKTPVEICTCASDVPCMVHLEGIMTYEAKGCEPHPCISSIPPDLGCVPVTVGVNAWDGGVPRYANACLDGCDLEVAQAVNPFFKKYVASQGETTLDLDTNPEGTTNLQVIANGIPRQINFREFMGLAVKLFELGSKVSGGLTVDSISLGYVKATDGSLGLSVINNGVAVGQPLALDVTKDAAGEITEVKLPLPV